MDLIVNGQMMNKMWRLDDLDAGRVGLDMMLNPFALVDTLENAELVAKVMNEHAKINTEEVKAGGGE